MKQWYCSNNRIEKLLFCECKYLDKTFLGTCVEARDYFFVISIDYCSVLHRIYLHLNFRRNSANCFRVKWLWDSWTGWTWQNNNHLYLLLELVKNTLYKVKKAMQTVTMNSAYELNLSKVSQSHLTGSDVRKLILHHVKRIQCLTWGKIYFPSIGQLVN